MAATVAVPTLGLGAYVWRELGWADGGGQAAAAVPADEADSHAAVRWQRVVDALRVPIELEKVRAAGDPCPPTPHLPLPAANVGSPVAEVWGTPSLVPSLWRAGLPGLASVALHDGARPRRCRAARPVRPAAPRWPVSAPRPTSLIGLQCP
jgi:hypothetical protein